MKNAHRFTIMVSPKLNFWLRHYMCPKVNSSSQVGLIASKIS